MSVLLVVRHFQQACMLLCVIPKQAMHWGRRLLVMICASSTLNCLAELDFARLLNDFVLFRNAFRALKA